MDELTSTVGIVALVGAAAAGVALAVTARLAARLRRLVAAQSAVLGAGETRDLTRHAHELGRALEALRERGDHAAARLAARLEAAEGRLDGAITHTAVVRYDALGELGGRQSSSIALLDEHRNGVVLSSILHREQARIYAKPVIGGHSELALSPEEETAVTQALASPEPGAGTDGGREQ